MGPMKALLLLSLLLISSCRSVSNLPPIRTAASVDLTRFAGDWFVIANIPTFIETQAFNSIERLGFNKSGNIRYDEPVTSKSSEIN